MTDTWHDDDFFKLTDEAWASYVQKQLRGPDATDTPTGPELPSAPPKGLHPVNAPRVERSPSVAPLTLLLESLWFKPGCECKGCDNPAAYYMQMHPVACCHPVYKSEGRLLHRLVCAEHLKGYEREAEDRVRKLNPPKWTRLFREPEPGKCPSCGMCIQLPSDVLQVVRAI